MTYTISNRSDAQIVTLYFAETYWTAAGQRTFNVPINGTSVLSNFDIFATAGGMKRQVGIAQALVNDSKMLIVDEPTAGLDPEERIRFRNLLINLAKDRVVILSTHIVEDIGQTCRNLTVLAKGRILFRGSPAELLSATQGHVWTLTLPGMEKPKHDLTVVSMLHLAEGTQDRLVGSHASEYPGADPVQPGLEDSYVWLMKQSEITTVTA
jgi:ABC-2 type transport system ATP-binding protein